MTHRVQLTATIVLTCDNEDDNPVAILDAILSGHEKLVGNFALDDKTSIVPEGEWTQADQYNALKQGWCIVTDETGQQFIGTMNQGECLDVTAQRYIVRRALVDDDPLAIRAIQYMKRHFPANFRGMVQSVMHSA